MRHLFCNRWTIATFICAVVLTSTPSYAAPKENDVLAAMKKATDFMMNTVSYRSGFVWQYSEDLSRQWGEVPARRTQIWVQGATNGVGEMLIDAYKVTGDAEYLEYAKRVAGAIIWGQHPVGGWHYLIDFDMPGIQKWYDEVASKCWGWEEYYHYYGNCTFDDNTTTGSIRFLMKLYMINLEPAHRRPLVKALDFVLESQFPNGAWPQRYPLMFNYPHDGHPDYTSHYTFNDGVIPNNIYVLLDAYEKLGDERYYKAARRGMDFYLISQGPPEQAGWAEQYDWNMQPAWARTYEPPSYKPGTTMACIRNLMKFYKITGDRRYLNPIPNGIAWIEKSVINTDPSKTVDRYGTAINYTHARYYEPGTNRPLFVHREGTNIDDGRYYVDYNLENLMCHLGMVSKLDMEPLKHEYQRVKAMIPKEAHAEYLAQKNAPETVPEVSPRKVEELIASIDKRGAWVTDIGIRNYVDPCDKAGEKTIKGISTGVFKSNMYALINYLKGLQK